MMTNDQIANRLLDAVMPHIKNLEGPQFKRVLSGDETEELLSTVFDIASCLIKGDC